MSDRIPDATHEMIDAIIAAFTLPPAAPDAWGTRRELIADRALYIRGALGSAASPDATVRTLTEAIRQVDANPLCAVTYEVARDDQAVTS